MFPCCYISVQKLTSLGTTRGLCQRCWVNYFSCGYYTSPITSLTTTRTAQQCMFAFLRWRVSFLIFSTISTKTFFINDYFSSKAKLRLVQVLWMIGFYQNLKIPLRFQFLTGVVLSDCFCPFLQTRLWQMLKKEIFSSSKVLCQNNIGLWRLACPSSFRFGTYLSPCSFLSKQGLENCTVPSSFPLYVVICFWNCSEHWDAWGKFWKLFI